ncbi:MAG: hypothetical protein ACK4OO_05160, partial [bacterium]
MNRYKILHYIIGLLALGATPYCSEIDRGNFSTHQNYIPEKGAQAGVHGLSLPHSASRSDKGEVRATPIPIQKNISKKMLSSDHSLTSFIIPGWSQLAQGKTIKGYVFIAAEAGLILAIISLRQYAHWLEKDYRQFAYQHSGASLDGNHQYYVDIGNWMKTEEYNEQRLRDRQFDRLYTEPEFYWRWQSDEKRRKFKEIRLASDR